MFLSALNFKQKKVFLGLAKTILSIDDNHIDEDEESYLRGLCSEMSLSYHDEEEIQGNEYPVIFDTTEIRKIVLLEAVALGHSNSDYHVSPFTLIDGRTINIFDG